MEESSQNAKMSIKRSKYKEIKASARETVQAMRDARGRWVSSEELEVLSHGSNLIATAPPRLIHMPRLNQSILFEHATTQNWIENKTEPVSWLMARLHSFDSILKSSWLSSKFWLMSQNISPSFKLSWRVELSFWLSSFFPVENKVIL